MILGFIFLFGIVIGLFMIAYEDNVPFAMTKKLLCKLGFHKRRINKLPKWRCQYCQKPRKHPALKVIDGGNKLGNSNFNF